jgi:hypothetical protein
MTWLLTTARAEHSRTLGKASPLKTCQGGSARARARARLTVFRRGVAFAALNTGGHFLKP